ncbi:RNA-directed DNA polymerase from mobile element jockey [Eumeta japonica]|uniref:RNA-directed DNA polymerase from mobile element jockey n=1 Tax=Eumeta variegata TaxID=151549 RepID=A0A4C1WD14_EUMVA|nr:RNA-directed DNA polymerase from mobile element jockey [Eumeta japonica]
MSQRESQVVKATLYGGLCSYLSGFSVVCCRTGLCSISRGRAPSRSWVDGSVPGKSRVNWISQLRSNLNTTRRSHLRHAPLSNVERVNYLGVMLNRNLYFKNHIECVRKIVIFYRGCPGAMLGGKSKLLLCNKRTMCIRTVMTYASPVFTHAVPEALNSLQVIQNKCCRVARGAHWCVWNSVLHRDLELPTVAKYMKDVSKRLFDIVESYPNEFFCSAASYEAQPYHPIRRPRNVLIDPPDTLTAKSRPSAFGEAVTAFQLKSWNGVTGSAVVRTADQYFYQGDFLVGFSPALRARTGTRVCDMHFLLPRRKREKRIRALKSVHPVIRGSHAASTGRRSASSKFAIDPHDCTQ